MMKNTDNRSIKEMTLLDIDNIYELEKRTFSDPWAKSAFESELHNKLAKYYLLEIDGDLVGYGGVWLILDEGHITNIAIDTSFRGLGLGYYMVSHMMSLMKAEGIKSVTLEVRASNVAAIKLYEKCGFEVAGVRKGYYQNNGEDALIMWATIS